MKFADVLPHLEAGRRVRRPWWGTQEYIRSIRGIVNDESGSRWTGLAEVQHLLASDWEVLPEEPAPAKPATCGGKAPTCDWVCDLPPRHKGRHGQAAGIETRSWPNIDEMMATIVELRAEVERLTRERDFERIDKGACTKLLIERTEQVRVLTRERDEAKSLRDGFRQSRDYWKDRFNHMRHDVSKALRDEE